MKYLSVGLLLLLTSCGGYTYFDTMQESIDAFPNANRIKVNANMSEAYSMEMVNGVPTKVKNQLGKIKTFHE